MDSFWDWFWLLVWTFFFVCFLMVLFQIIIDLFRDRDLRVVEGTLGHFLDHLPLPRDPHLPDSAWQGHGRAASGEMQRAQAATDQYIQSVAGSGNPADQIASAKNLLDSGAITQEEFEKLKQKALAS